MTNGEQISSEVEVRKQKLKALAEAGIIPFAERFERNHAVTDIKTLADGTENVRVAGRIVGLRYFGKLCFGHLFDQNGRAQFSLQKNVLNEGYDTFRSFVDIGDYVGLEGKIFTTKTGEKTLSVQKWAFLSKALRPLPEKFHGITDDELRMRKRYLDLISTEETMARFKKRSLVISAIRNYLDTNGFLEIDTPVLINKASGALATPFMTHHNALDIDVYLRIAPETYLKRAVAGGFDRVYEFARCFRNEGMDPSHIPDFTLLEWYCSYWNYEDNMNFIEALLKHVLEKVHGGNEINYGGTQISFAGAWPRISFRDLLLKDCGIDIDAITTKEDLLGAIRGKGIALDTEMDLKKTSRGTVIDLLYKKVSRPKLVNPVFIVKHPIETSPLARKNDANPLVVDRFQLVVNGWEIVNAYSELIDPIDQAERFKEQLAAREAGDTEAMEVDQDFLTCMEYGMPPMSGLGLGVDRFIALLTDARSLRDVVLFPLMRPE